MFLIRASLCFAVCFAAVFAAKQNGTAPFIICLAGDSIMRPVPVHLRPMLSAETQRPFQIKEWAQGGLSTVTYASFLRRNWERWKNVRPDVILVQLGTNDAFAIQRGQSEKALFEENYAAVIRTLKSLSGNNGRPPVLLLASAPLIHGHPDDGPVNDLIRNVINPTIRKTAEAEGAVVVDQYAVLEGQWELYDPDGVHPNSEGEKALARNWLRAIKAELSGKKSGKKK